MRLTTLPLVGLFCASLFVSAQDKPTPSAEIDQALRDRVSQFMQFTIDRAFSKAYALVADDAKDSYLSSGKPQYSKFKIQKIEYSPDLQRATVTTLVTRILSMQGREIPTEIPVMDLWKLSDGKWMFYNDPDVLDTPFGRVKIDRSAVSHAGSVPKDVGPEAADRAAGNLKLEATADKKEVLFVQGLAGSDEVVIHNGFPGAIEIDSDIVGDYGSFAVQPAHSPIPSGKDAVLKVSYKPMDRSLVTNLRVSVEPFNRTLMIPLKTTSSGSTAASAPAH